MSYICKYWPICRIFRKVKRNATFSIKRVEKGVEVDATTFSANDSIIHKSIMITDYPINLLLIGNYSSD